MNFNIQILKNVIFDLPSVLLRDQGLDDFISSIDEIVEHTMIALAVPLERLLMYVVLECAHQLNILEDLMIMIQVFLDPLHVLQHLGVVVEGQ